MLEIVGILLFLDPGTQFPGNENITVCSTKRYKNQAGMNLTRHYYYYYFLAHQHKACRQLKIKHGMTAVGD